MRKYFVMHRRGVFRAAKATENQCARPGHNEYHYRVDVVFSQGVDGRGFVIDHNDIETAVQIATLQGSCEEMQLHVCSIVQTLFSSRSLEPYALRVRVVAKGVFIGTDRDYPLYGEGAHIDCVSIQPGYEHTLPLLNA